jgi:anti-sigma factor RsiW
MNTHLTDEQMYELLDRNPNAQAQSHLQSCAGCRSEVSSLRASLLDFRAAATSFAAAEVPPLAARTVAPRAHSFRMQIWAASLTAATALLALSIAVVHPVKAPVNGVTTTTSTQPAATTESDDALLDGIQQDLSTNIPPPLEPLEVPAAAGETSTQN